MRSPTVTSDGRWADRVQSALDGDEGAWREIVDSLAPVAWKVLNNYSLDAADREDAFASTFFRLYQSLSTIRRPRALPGWVATAARNEANTIWRKRGRAIPTEELPLRELPVDTVHEGLLDDELLEKVMKAFSSLPEDAQALLRLLTAVPPISYNEISELLHMPKGSIGPTAGRHLNQLRRLLGSYTSGDLS